MTEEDKPETEDKTVTDDLGDRHSPDETAVQDASTNQEYDQQIAVLFQDMRRSSGQPLDSLAQQLGTEPPILEALEKGDLDSLPAWGQSSKVISNYAALLGISSEPILRRLALNIQARNQKTLPDTAKEKDETVKQEKSDSQGALPSHEQAEKSKQPAVVVPAKQPIYRPVDLPSQQTKDAPPAQDKKTTQARQLSSLSIDKAAVVPIEEQSKLPLAHTETVHGFESERIEPTFSKPKSDTPPKISMPESVPPGSHDNTASPPPVQPEPLRADRRGNFGEESTIAAPNMSRLEEGGKKGIGVLTWLVLSVILLAAAYIAWSFFTQPRLGELLLQQLSFLTP